MIISRFLLFFIFLNISFSQEHYKPLFKIYENGLFGFIDSTGKIIIPPKFKGAGDFSEGLAPVREGGYFGYIGVNGNFVLEPKYDFAEPFNNGFAMIYMNGIPNYINRYGNKIIPFECSSIYPFENGRALIYTSTRKAGFINENGELIIDTVYTIMSNFKEGLSIVQHPYEKYGVIDTAGNIIVSFGKFHNISDFQNGFAKVTWYENDTSQVSKWSQGYINRKGEIVLSFLHSFYIDLSEKVSEDSLFIIAIYQHGSDGKHNWTNEREYGGVMNIKGELVCTDSSNYRFGFLEEKLCTIDSNNRYAFIDRNGKITGSRFFNYGNGKKIIYSVSVINNSGKNFYGIIDTSLNFIIDPFYDLSYHRGIDEDYFIFGQYLTDEKGNYISDKDRNHISKWGICGLDGTVIHEPAFENVDYSGFVKDLILVLENGKPAYINKKGKKVWQQDNHPKDKIKVLDIDYQLVTWYGEHYKWMPLISKPIDDEIENLPYTEGDISVVITDKEETLFKQKYAGISLYLVNDRENAVSAPSVDGNLYMVLQAKDKDGIWKSIEAYPSSSCGNSYVPTEIAGKYFRKYSMPKYSGEFKTKIRAALRIYSADKKYYEIYSNEISGGINPAQFWRRTGIWDNYDPSLLTKSSE